MKLFKSFIFIIGLSSLVSESAIAQSNPFRQGVSRSPLSADEKTSLLEWVNKSSTTLQDALRRAGGKSLKEAGDIYMNAIRLAILDSFEKSRRGETLMRYVLAQALDLTYGIPTVDGRSFETKGVLNGTVQSDLIAVILEDSIRLALKVIPEDVRAINKGDSLIDLPFGDVAASRIVLAREWLESTFEWTGAYDLSVAALSHWYTTVADDENLRRNADASLILEVNDLLNQERVGLRFSTPTELLQRVRLLRGMLRRVATSVSGKARFIVNRTNDDPTKDPELDIFASPSKNLNVAQTIRIASAMRDIEKNNLILYDYFQSHIDDITQRDVETIIKNLYTYEYSSYENDKPNSARNTTLRIFKNYVSKRSSSWTIEEGRTVFKYFTGLGNVTVSAFNPTLESYVRANASNLSFSELEGFLGMLRAYAYSSYENDKSDSWKNTRIRLLDAWYAAHK